MISVPFMIFFFHCKPKIINGIRVIMERNQRSDPRILEANIGKYGLNSRAEHLKGDPEYCPFMGGGEEWIFIYISGKSNQPTSSPAIARQAVLLPSLAAFGWMGRCTPFNFSRFTFHISHFTIKELILFAY